MNIPCCLKANHCGYTKHILCMKDILYSDETRRKNKKQQENAQLKLNSHKTLGADGITSSVFKELTNPVAANVITVIFRKSYDTGEMPNH